MQSRAEHTIDWDAVAADPRFQALRRQKAAFLWGLMAFSVGYYFLLPIGAAWFGDVFGIRVLGPINVGLLFALSEFVVAWAVAIHYSRRAGARYDRMAAEIAADVVRRTGG